MDDKEKIEKVFNQIHAPEKLKDETFEKMKNTKQYKTLISFNFVLSIAAVFVVTFMLGALYYNTRPSMEYSDIAEIEEIAFETSTPDLNHFESNEELREYLEMHSTYRLAYNNNSSDIMKSATLSSATFDSIQETESAGVAEDLSNTSNYYETNTQVENVDEADIVKTDGKYIYYLTNLDNVVYIIDANNLELVSSLNYLSMYENDSSKHFYPRELFLKDDRLVVLGSYTEYKSEEDDESNNIVMYDRMYNPGIYSTKAYIYDISSKELPRLVREVAIDGNYNTSRLIDNTLYLVGGKSIYYLSELKDEEILPVYYDSKAQDEYTNIEATDIIYIKDSNEQVYDLSYELIGAVNIKTDDEMIVETFLGYSSNVYCSENNLYITQQRYERENNNSLYNTEIYKFNISSGGLKYQCKTKIEGNTKNQFSLDEYKGNLRVATTITEEKEPSKKTFDNEIFILTAGETATTNALFVLDENLNEIGRLEDFGVDEKIYSVRFIGDIGYIVTFEQIDPLFTIDLSDPSNPKLKGELEIPGYSSYLHPYDSDHIFGIGYNVKDNGYGGVTNSTVKLSMFDVSNLNDPKEIFNRSFGEDYSYSEVTDNHKLLMYDKQRSLMAFPISIRDGYNYTNSVVIIKIDLDNNDFKINGQINLENMYDLRKVIYIEDTIYIMGVDRILALDINSLDVLGELKLSDKLDDIYENRIYTDGAMTVTEVTTP